MSSCRDAALAVACLTAADGSRTSVFVNNVYDANGALLAVYYTDAAGTVVDPAGGTVSAGQCPVYQPDVEWTELCDVAADGTVTRFMCRTITAFDESGAVIDPVAVDNFEMDKVTAYVPAGEVGDCATCADETALGLITDLSLL